jgi:putative ABC transport system permease protein
VRTFLTTLGVIIGVAAIVTLLSVAIGFEESITGQIKEIGGVNQVTVFRGKFDPGMKRGGGTVAKSEMNILDDATVEEIESLEGVHTVVPSISVNGILEVGRYTTTTSFTGIDPKKGEELEISMEDGRFLRGNDRDVIVVGYSVDDDFVEKKTQKLVEDVVILGKKAEIVVSRMSEDGGETKSFRVRIIGITEEQDTQADYEIYMPLKLAVEIKEWTFNVSDILEEGGYDRLTVEAVDTSAVIDVTEKITDMGFLAYSSRQRAESLNRIFAILEVVLLGIGAIALIVAALGIINTMLMSILERTREIGLMKVVGASNTDVTKIFLVEALAIGVLGGVGGVALGYVVSQIVDVVAGAYVVLEGETQSLVVMPLWLVGFAMGFAMLIGLVSGVYPARKAARLSPVEALRHE